MPSDSDPLVFRLGVELESLLIMGILLPVALASVGGYQIAQGDATVMHYAMVVVGLVCFGGNLLMPLARRMIIRGDELYIRTSFWRSGVSVRLSSVTGLKVENRRAILERAEQDPFVVELGMLRKQDVDRVVHVLQERIVNP